VKAHTGIEGNELADKLAKAAAQYNGEQKIVYNRIPITSVATDLKTEGLTKWQRQWESTDKGALCRSFFQTVEQTKIKNTNDIGVHGYCLLSRGEKIVSAQVQINR